LHPVLNEKVLTFAPIPEIILSKNCIQIFVTLLNPTVQVLSRIFATIPGLQISSFLKEYSDNNFGFNELIKPVKRN